jgi:hypothetical protein
MRLGQQYSLMRSAKSTLYLCLFMAFIAGAAYGAPQKQAQAAPKAAAKAKSASAAMKSDAAIEADIRARLARSKVSADKFQVHVQGGVATFEGHTNVVQHKGVATRMAKAAGAVAVNNRIQSSEAARAKASKNLVEGRRRAQIKRGDTRSEDRSTPRASVAK